MEEADPVNELKVSRKRLRDQKYKAKKKANLLQEKLSDFKEKCICSKRLKAEKSFEKLHETTRREIRSIVKEFVVHGSTDPNKSWAFFLSECMHFSKKKGNDLAVTQLLKSPKFGRALQTRIRKVKREIASSNRYKALSFCLNRKNEIGRKKFAQVRSIAQQADKIPLSDHLVVSPIKKFISYKRGCSTVFQRNCPRPPQSKCS